MGIVKIDGKGKKVDISFNKKFYDIKSVNRGKEDFKKICEVYIKDNSDRIFVTLKPKIEDINFGILGYEFCNYVFGVMKSRQVI